MQMISGFLEIAAPYAYLLWLIPAALVLYFLGWLARGFELTTSITEQNESLDSREQQLRARAEELEERERVLLESQSRLHEEQEATQVLEHNSQILQYSLDEARQQQEQLEQDKTVALHQLDEKIIQLEHTQRKLKKYQLATREIEDKFAALRTKYKQRDAKLYGEIVELRAYIFDLKANKLQTEKERNQLRDAVNRLEQLKSDSISNNDAVYSELEKSENDIQQLKELGREQAQEHQREIASLREDLESIETLEAQIKDKSALLAQRGVELEQSSKQNENLQQQLEQAAEAHRQQFLEHSKQQEQLTLKYNDIKLESRREIDNLKGQIKQLEALSTINKNQVRTIRTLENKLEDSRKQADSFQTLTARLVSTQSELEKVSLRLKSTDSELRQNKTELHAATDRLQQIQFENRKIPSLQNQLREKNSQLRQLDSDLLKLERSLQQSQADNGEQSKLSNEITLLKQKYDDSQKTLSQLNIELSSAQQLEDTVVSKNAEIARLNAEIESRKSLEIDLVSAQAEVSKLRQELSEQVLRNQQISQQKQTIKDQQQEIEGQKQTIAQINKSLSSYRERAERVTEQSRSLLAAQSRLSAAQKTVGERNNEIAALKSQHQKQLQQQKEQVQRLEKKCDQLAPLQQALLQSEKKSRSTVGELNRLRVELAEAEKREQDAPRLSAIQHALETAETNAADLARQLDQLQAQVLENEALRKRLHQLEPLTAALEQAENRIKELSSELTPLQIRSEEQASRITKLNSKIADLQPLAGKLAAAESRAATLSSQLDERLASALASEPAGSDDSDNADDNAAAATTDNSPNLVEQLQQQVQSLTRERDLGLERVKELCESARELGEKDKLIRQLKAEIADTRFDQRELDTLRTKIERQEQTLVSRNLAIEDLKKMLRKARNLNGQVAAPTGPSVKKTQTARKYSNGEHEGRDDLKKIRGIGPVLEKLLNENGITRYQQIAEFTEQDIEQLSAALNTFPGRVTRDDWIGGARKEQRKKYGTVKS